MQIVREMKLWFVFTMCVAFLTSVSLLPDASGFVHLCGGFLFFGVIKWTLSEAAVRGTRAEQEARRLYRVLFLPTGNGG
jgi:hypothetical protein